MPPTSPPPKGHFVLHTNVKPPLPAGAYRLVSTQTGTPFPVAPDTTYVTLAAPRYTMPVDQILSSFPPANAEGAFGDRLPQIVLKRRTLPWERNPAGGLTTSDTPWLALVVVAEGEAELSTPVPVAQCVTPGTPLLDPGDRDVEQGVHLSVTETVKNKIFPCEQDLPLLCHVREVDVSDTELANGDDDGWLAVVLANRLPVYDTAADRPVRYLACLVNLEGQLPVLPPPTPPDDHFTFELAQDWTVLAQLNPVGPDPLVLGNLDLGGITLPAAMHQAAPADARAERAPGTGVVAGRFESVTTRADELDGGTAMTAASVRSQWATSTAGASAAVTKAAADPDAAYLVRDTMSIGFRYPISLVALEPVYRFPVLAHWSFTTNGPDTFETLMQKLDVGLLGSVDPPAADAPPAPAPPPEVVQTGHVGLGHRTRRGDPLRAWYRGPLVPFPTERDAVVDGRLPVAHAADQLKRVVPGGREDLGLAAAFEIGRLLGLSQLSVVAALTRFRGAQFGAGRVKTVVGGILAAELPSFVDSFDTFDLGRFVALSVLGDWADDPVGRLGPRRPVVDPGRELRVDGDLDELIAGGLGLDLAVVRKRADAVGVVAALAQTAVPLAFEAGGVKLDDRAVEGLRATLSAEVDAVAAVAAPPGRLGTPAGRAAARASRRGRVPAPPDRDALDELIDELIETGSEDD